MKKYGFSIEGVPTMRFVSPGSHTTQEYKGERTAKAIKVAVYKAMPSFVKLVSAQGLDRWIEDGSSRSSRLAVLFSAKGDVPPLFKGISSAYRGYIDFAQVTIADLARAPGKPLAQRFELLRLPTLVVLRRSADYLEDAKWLADKFSGRDFAALSFGASETPSFRKLEAWLMGYGRSPRASPSGTRKRRKAAATEL
mmetsp:Transcript_104862/g.326989  ORF Transcript_104862/g.326989 Transcript_104862/m.326989 type:complete len:196 (-) Transcript_104862:225-812(-)